MFSASVVMVVPGVGVTKVPVVTTGHEPTSVGNSNSPDCLLYPVSRANKRLPQTLRGRSNYSRYSTQSHSGTHYMWRALMRQGHTCLITAFCSITLVLSCTIVLLYMYAIPRVQP